MLGTFIIGVAIGYLGKINIKNKKYFKLLENEITERKKLRKLC